MFQQVSEKNFLKGWSSYKGNVKFAFIFIYFCNLILSNYLKVFQLQIPQMYIIWTTWIHSSFCANKNNPEHKSQWTSPMDVQSVATVTGALSALPPYWWSHYTGLQCSITGPNHMPQSAFLTKHYKGDAMGRASCTHVEEEKFIHSFYEKTWRKESTWKT